MYLFQSIMDNISPAAVAEGEMNLYLQADKQIWIENYKGILALNDTEIVLKGKRKKMVVQGEQLCMDYFTGDSLRICGKVKAILWEEIGCLG